MLFFSSPYQASKPLRQLSIVASARRDLPRTASPCGSNGRPESNPQWRGQNVWGDDCDSAPLTHQLSHALRYAVSFKKQSWGPPSGHFFVHIAANVCSKGPVGRQTVSYLGKHELRPLFIHFVSLGYIRIPFISSLDFMDEMEWILGSWAACSNGTV